MRRAISSLIATLLLVAVAVIGSTLVIIYTQDYMNSAQISGNLDMQQFKEAVTLP